MEDFIKALHAIGYDTKVEYEHPTRRLITISRGLHLQLRIVWDTETNGIGQVFEAYDRFHIVPLVAEELLQTLSNRK